MDILRRLYLLVAFGGLLLIQWPFKAISEFLDRPIDRLHDRAERQLEKKPR